MKIILIGSPGSGKSTLARELALLTDSPVLHLDKLWHATDYSAAANLAFRKQLTDFIATHEDWIIDGNYQGSLDLRLPEADLILWLKISRYKALYRIITRSLKTRYFKKNRPDMAENFQEKWDKEYWAFIKWVWQFPKNNEPKMLQLLEQYEMMDKVVILTTKKDKEKLMRKLS